MRHASSVTGLGLVLAAALWTGGCVEREESRSEEARVSVEPSPEELGRIGARLHEESNRAEEILEEEGLTWEEFEAAVREVAESVEESREYAEAFRAEREDTATGS